VGEEAAAKYPGKRFHEIEDDVALDYEKHQVGGALPSDHVRGASKAAWAKASGWFRRAIPHAEYAAVFDQRFPPWRFPMLDHGDPIAGFPKRILS
jgi:hypothetical protein